MTEDAPKSGHASANLTEIRRSLFGEYRDFTLLVAGALLTLAGTCVNQAFQSSAQERALQATERRELQRDAAGLVNELFRLSDSVDFRSARVLEVADAPSDSVMPQRIDEYEHSATKERKSLDKMLDIFEAKACKGLQRD